MVNISDPLIDAEIDRVLTQYRESPNLLGWLRVYLAQVVEIRIALAHMAERFDLDNAEGEQLTFIGARMGFPRNHPAGRLRTFFGFPGRPAVATPIEGWLSGEWDTGPETEQASMPDALYRRFLQARRYKLELRRDRESFMEAARILLGPDVHLLGEKAGALALATGRLLAEEERVRVHLFREVLPVAPGVRLEVWEVTKTFGFGEGWGGWNEGHWPYRIW
jgi:hypothetical protein